jgi:hypothetical protein
MKDKIEKKFDKKTGKKPELIRVNSTNLLLEI